MEKTDRNRFDEREIVALGRRDLLRGAAAAGIATLGSLIQPTPGRAVIWEEGDEQCQAHVQEKDLGDNIDDTLLVGFMQVSSTLIGMPLNSEADRLLGRQYLERYARVVELADLLPKLLDAHKTQMEQQQDAEAVAEALMKSRDVRPAAEQLIYLWYLSAFYLPLNADPAKRLWVYGRTDHFERAFLWKVVRAHAPMAQPTPQPTRRPGWTHVPRPEPTKH